MEGEMYQIRSSMHRNLKPNHISFKEDLLIYQEQYNLSNQVAQPGSLSNTQHKFHHNKASKKVKDFNATWDLMHVVTNTNLLALATELSGHGIHEEYDATAEEFHTLIENIFTKSSFLHKWDNLTSLGEPNDDNMDEDDNMVKVEPEEVPTG